MIARNQISLFEAPDPLERLAVVRATLAAASAAAEQIKSNPPTNESE